jgi:hypothetical protein
MLNLEPIKARLSEATPGPWRASNPWGYERLRVISAPGGPVSTAYNDVDGFNNADFIAAAPEDMAALIAEVERLRSEMEDDFETLQFVRWKMRQMKAKLKRADEVENKSADLINRLENKIDKLEDAIYCHKLNCKESRSEDEKLWKVLEDV